MNFNFELCSYVLLIKPEEKVKSGLENGDFYNWTVIF